MATHLDAHQVLKEAFDPASGALRTTGTGGGSSTQISDSLGNTATLTQIASKYGIDVNILSLVLDLTDKLSTFDLYSLNNFQDGDPLLVGMATLDGKYLIKKFFESTGAMLYANASNNPSITTYDDAWTNRLALNFNKINELTGV